MAKKLNVYLSEDDPLIQNTLRSLLCEHNTRAFCSTPDLVENTSPHSQCDLAFLDLMHAGDPSGDRSIQLIKTIKDRHPHAEIVIQSGVDDIHCMRKCIEQGATKYILKENITSEVPALIQRTLYLKELRSNIDKFIIGESDVVQRLKSRLTKVLLDSDVDVLIEGETGTGKELCARALHINGPFVSVNASAIPPELFESEFFGAEKGSYTGSEKMRKGHLENADGGVLFIDEIQALPLNQQSKLLRVLESRKFSRVGSSAEKLFDGRIISASNENLKELCQQGKFREDLYYRLSSFTLNVPPLRVRTTDIPLLSEYFLHRFSKDSNKKLTVEAQQYLSHHYDWPGNIRELRNLIRALVIETPIPKIGVDEIKAYLANDDYHITVKNNDESFQVKWNEGYDQNIEMLERYMLKQTLAKHKSSTAREYLKLSRSRFYEKLKKFKLLN